MYTWKLKHDLICIREELFIIILVHLWFAKKSPKGYLFCFVHFKVLYIRRSLFILVLKASRFSLSGIYIFLLDVNVWYMVNWFSEMTKSIPGKSMFIKGWVMLGTLKIEYSTNDYFGKLVSYMIQLPNVTNKRIIQY